jgi:hypothetical protein
MVRKHIEPPRKQRAEEKTGVLRERAMLVRFSVSRWYGTGADEEVVQDLKEKHSARGDIGTFTKRFMSRDRMGAINAVTNEARKFHKTMTLPWGDSGSRLLNADLFFDYKKEMTAFEMRFGAAVEEFLARFPEFVKQEKERLNGLFKEGDYPSAEALRKRFTWRLDIEPIPSAEDFRVDLGEDELHRIRHDIEHRVEEAVKEASGEIYARIGELVSNLQEKLTDADAQVRESLFVHLKEMVVVLPKLNMTNDPHLAAIGEQITKDLLAQTADEVRDDPKKRNDVAKKAGKILDAMKSFATPKGESA